MHGLAGKPNKRYRKRVETENRQKGCFWNGRKKLDRSHEHDGAQDLDNDDE